MPRVFALVPLLCLAIFAENMVLDPHCDTIGLEPANTCYDDAECRLFDSYSNDDPCRCLALHISQDDPEMVGPRVSCFMQPCAGQAAVCNPRTNQCEVRNASDIPTLPGDGDDSDDNWPIEPVEPVEPIPPFDPEPISSVSIVDSNRRYNTYRITYSGAYAVEIRFHTSVLTDGCKNYSIGGSLQKIPESYPSAQTYLANLAVAHTERWCLRPEPDLEVISRTAQLKGFADGESHVDLLVPEGFHVDATLQE